jgi:nucleoside-diphosphate-sugar epimerase
MLKDHIHRIVFEDIDSITSAFKEKEKFRDKNILISGANGFLASYLVYFFLALNDRYNIRCKVVGVSRNAEKANSRFGELLKRSDFEMVIADVSKSFSLKHPIHFIIHAASQASPKYYSTDPVGTLNANVLGTNNLLEMAKANNVESFLFFSSGEVYGQVDHSKVPTKEDQYGYVDLLNVRSCYAESKRLAETMCVCWHHQYQIPAKIVRPFHTYGPGLDLKDGRVYADFVSDILNNKNIVLMSDGSAKRAFCYLADATLGFITVLIHGVNGKAYNIGNGKAEVSIFDLANKLCSIFPEKNLKVIRDEGKRDKNYLVSPIQRNSPDTRAANQLGWEASTGIEKGFERTIKSFL